MGKVIDGLDRLAEDLKRPAPKYFVTEKDEGDHTWWLVQSRGKYGEKTHAHFIEWRDQATGLAERTAWAVCKAWNEGEGGQ